MAQGPRYKVKLRRRREGRTDYRNRLELIKSGAPRLIVRVRARSTVAQVINYKPEGDLCVVTGTATELRKLGYKGNTGNVPAAYLTGFVCGLKAKKAGVKDAILDLGLETKSRRTFAALKGVIDGGINVPHGELHIPDDMIKGKHIAAWASKAKAPQFKEYKQRGVDASKMDAHVEAVKAEISKRYSK